MRKNCDPGAAETLNPTHVRMKSTDQQGVCKSVTRGGSKTINFSVPQSLKNNVNNSRKWLNLVQRNNFEYTNLTSI